MAVQFHPFGEGLANVAMIRITTDPEFGRLHYPDQFMGVLELHFADIIDGDRDKWNQEAIDYFEKMGMKTHPISLEQAKQIVEFAEQMRDQECHTMVVHCQAGYSRSPAVAVALAEHLGEKQEYHKLCNLVGRGRFSPNPTVLSRIREATGARDRRQQELEQLWKEIP